MLRAGLAWSPAAQEKGFRLQLRRPGARGIEAVRIPSACPVGAYVAHEFPGVAGRRIAVFFTKTYTRIVHPALAELDPHLRNDIAARSLLARAWRDFEHALDQEIQQAAIAA